MVYNFVRLHPRPQEAAAHEALDPLSCIRWYSGHSFSRRDVLELRPPNACLGVYCSLEVCLVNVVSHAEGEWLNDSVRSSP